MANTTFNIDNAAKPAPKWFRKLRKAIGVLTLAANVMVQSWGLPDPLLVAKIQLWCTIGIGALLEALDIMLANGEDYAPVKPAAPNDLELNNKN